MFRYIFGRKTRSLIKLAAIIFAFQFIFRASFFFWFNSTAQEYELSDLFKGVHLGLKFDLRVTLLLCLPLALFIVIINPHQRKWAKHLWASFYTLIIFIFTLGFFFDFAYYSYLNARVNGTVLKFLRNPDIILNMMWESYPIIPMFIAATLFSIVLYFLILKFVFSSDSKYIQLSMFQKLFVTMIVAALYLGGLYGKASYYPLRWSEAFFSSNNFISAMALNPWHYFADTFKANKSTFDKEKSKNSFSYIAEHLQLDPTKELNFARPIQTTGEFTTKPNVVLIVMESLAAYMTTNFGQPKGTTPNMEFISDNGYEFKNYYVPSEGTARSMFGLITGVPDVSSYRTSSRNPLIVSQNTAINAFSGYDKFYFLGGSANWGEIRGVVSHNIPNVHIIEEGMFDSPRTDVWGISDYHLFEEVVSKLSNRDNSKPFFALVQTAGFHRPYTIPEVTGGFVPLELSDDELAKRGFNSNDQLNSMRFSDHALGHFLKLIKNSTYFKNTIIAVVGDHGLPDLNASNLTKGQIMYSLERFHTPFVIYSPDLISTPKKIETYATQPDVLVTLAGITGNEFTNTTLGRNLMSPKYKSHFGFIYTYYSNPKKIGLLDDTFYVQGDNVNGIQGLYKYRSDDPSKDYSSEFPEVFEKMRGLCLSYYESARYLLYNNPNPLVSNNKNLVEQKTEGK